MLPRFLTAALAALFAVAAPAAAKEPAAPYTHQASGMTAPSRLAGLPQAAVDDRFRNGLDVVLNYYNAERSEVLTLYFYRTSHPSAGLWFDQSRRPIETSAIGRRRIARAATTPFRTPGASADDGLVVTYPVDRNRLRSTGLAMVALDGWMVKLRMSSATLDQTALGRAMIGAVQELGWPERRPTSATFETIPECTDRVRHVRKAQLASSNEELAARASEGLLAAEAQEGQRLCRDRWEQLLGVYRRPRQQDGYVLAIADSGRIARVRRLDPQNPQSLYAVDFLDLDAGYVAALYSDVPTPAQVLEAVVSALGGRAVARIPFGTPEERRRDPEEPAPVI